MEHKRNRHHDEFDRSLAHNMVRVGHLMRQQMQSCIAELGVTPEQWQALVYIHSYETEDEGLTQNELAELTFKDKTTISRLVENMVRHVMLVRSEGQDRRTYRLKLSARGREIVEAAWPLVQNHFVQAVFTTLEPEERSELLRLLLKVRREFNDL